jgi:diaminopimelate epimerase
MSGAGNLFVVIDNLDGRFSGEDGQKLARILCEESQNYPAQEGLMFLESGSTPNKMGLDFECKFFNPDGSLGMMCGNGGRVIARFAKDAGVKLLGDGLTRFKMSGEIYSAEFVGENIKLFMPAPSIMPKEILMPLNDYVYQLKYVNTGTHHAVIKPELYWDEDFYNLDLAKISPPLRSHKKVEPHGANINFYKIVGDKVILRTYEKGVEAETGACGTGAVAVALVVHEDDGLPFPIHIIPTSGEELIVDIIGSYQKIEKIILEGPATVIDENIEREIDI